MKTLKTLFVATAAIVVGFCSTHAQSLLTEGLICYYPLDGSVHDVSGFGNEPTSVVATPAPDRFGNPTNALAFSGNGSGIVTAGFYENWDIFTNYEPTPITESIWFCPSNTLQTNDVYSLITDASSYDAEYGTSLYSSGYGLQGYFFTYFDNGFSASATQTTFQSNTWYHLVGVFTDTSIQLYINGALAGSTSFGYEDPETYGDLNIGAQEWSGGGYRFGFTGRLDDVRIYNRAFSSDEVAQLHELETPHPALAVASAVVPTFSSLTVGSSYQLQVSGTVNGSFTNYGAPFVATSSAMPYSGYFLVSNSTQLYFKLLGL